VDSGRLKNIPVFADLGEDDLTRIGRLASEVSVPEGKELVREGDYSYEMLVIEEGTATVEHDGEQLAELGPGDVVGEMGVLEREKRNATVTATSSMRLIVLDHWDIKKLERQAPATLEQLRALVAARS
jgi:CRP-like cAMP-binding protein